MFKLRPDGSATFLIIVVVSAMVLIATVGAFPESSPEEQLPAGPGREKAEAACLSCHEARIIVQQRLSQTAWAKEVDKMVKWGAQIGPNDRDALIAYLSANFPPEQKSYEAPRTTGDLMRKSKSKR